MDPLLRFGETILIPATQPFTVTAHFVPDMGPQARVLLASIGSNFARWFFEKSEDAAPSSRMEWFELQRNASNSIILNELGGAKQAETTMASAYWLLLQQPAGQAGPLATNGWGNVFYVPDAAGRLRAVYLHWCDDAWIVEAMHIEGATEWPIRDRVFRPIVTAP